MKSLKSNIKLFLPQMIVLVLLVAGIFISLARALSIGRQVDDLYNESYVVKNAADTINAALEAMQKSVFRCISNESQEITYQEMANEKDRTVMIQEQLAIAKQSSLGDLRVVSSLEENLSELGTMQEHVFDLMGRKEYAEAQEYMENSNIPLIKEEQEEVAKLIRAAEIKAARIFASLRKTRRNTVILLIALGMISVLFGARACTSIRRLQK